jgi:hypothetical protein
MSDQLTVRDLYRLDRDAARWLDDARARLRQRTGPHPTGHTSEASDD